MSPFDLIILLILYAKFTEGKIFSVKSKINKLRRKWTKFRNQHSVDASASDLEVPLFHIKPIALGAVDLFTDHEAAVDYLETLDTLRGYEEVFDGDNVDEMVMGGRCKDKILTKRLLRDPGYMKPYEHFVAKWFNLYDHVPGYAHEGSEDAVDENVINNVHVMVANYIKTLTEVNHPNLPLFVGAFKHERDDEMEEEAFTVIMRYIRGVNIATFDRFLPKSEDMIATLSYDILQALDALHAKNIAHMKVIPENVMFDEDNKRFILIDYQYLRPFGQRVYDEEYRLIEVSPSVDLCSLKRILLSLLEKVHLSCGRKAHRKASGKCSPELQDFISSLSCENHEERRRMPAASEYLQHPFILKYFPPQE